MQITAEDVLQAFRRDEPNLFIGAASVTAGLVVIGFLFLRRRFDRLLSFFAWFAVLYGERTWLRASILGLEPVSLFHTRCNLALNFFVAVPAFLFFQETGLIGRAGRWIAYTVCLLEMALIAAIFLGAPITLLSNLNSAFVMAGSFTLLILVFRNKSPDRDTLVFRAGLLIFVAFVFWTNTRSLQGRDTAVEPYGFGLFLCCVGYVAAKRALDRDQQLTALHQELEIAKRIQLSILPTSFPASPHFTVAARYVPMTSVAGDFYEFLPTGSSTAGLLVADVSGHGVPAALIASMVKLATSAQRQQAAHPDRLLAGVNESLCGNTQRQFVTAAYVYLDAEQSELRYAAAGHPPMLLLRDGQVYPIEENGLVLGLFPSAAYTATQKVLRKGDRLLLYTDGIIEAANGAEQEFGQERLSRLLTASTGDSVEETADLILSTVQGWASAQTDDLTVVVCDYH
jgi:sigma-B regulation protein RsbU (phosphoserine phosphatase)